MATRSISESPQQSKKRTSSVVKPKPARKPSAAASRPEASEPRKKEPADSKAKQPVRTKAAEKSQTDGKKAAQSGDDVVREKAPRRTPAHGHGSTAKAEGKRPSASRAAKKNGSEESPKQGNDEQSRNGHVARSADSKTSGKRRKKSPGPGNEVQSRGIERLPEAGPDATMVASGLHQAMESHANAHSLGHVARDTQFDWGEIENPDLQPDLAFVSFDRWAAYRHVPTALTWHVVPDLVVEVLDEAEKTEEIGPRVSDYFKAGVNRVWVVYPQDMRVFDYQSASEYEILSGKDRLSGGTILPGFELALDELAKRHE